MPHPDKVLAVCPHETPDGRVVELRVAVRHTGSGKAVGIAIESWQTRPPRDARNQDHPPSRLQAAFIHTSDIPEVVEAMSRYLPSEQRQ